MIRRATRGGRIVDPAPRSFHRLLRADPLSVRHTLTDLRRHLAPDCPDEALGRLELALAEVLNNIVEHGAANAEAEASAGAAAAGGVARGRTVHLLVVAEPGGMRCVISDTGGLLPDECLAPRNLPRCEPELPEGGFGWYLIQDLVSDLTYSRTGRRNCLAFTLPAEGRRVAAA